MTFQKKILLVDHDSRVTHLLRTALLRGGNIVLREERDGRRALQFARWFRPDVILLDTTGPGADDLSLAEELAANPFLSDTAVVCLSSLLVEPKLVSSGTFNGYSFTATPVGIDEVVEAVQCLLGAQV